MIPTNLMNPEAEQALLGSLLIDPTLIHQLEIAPAYFFIERNQWIFEAMLTVANTGKPLDILLILDVIGEEREKEIGGAGYLMQLLNHTPTSVHGPYYAELLRELALRRDLFHLAGKLARSTSDRNNGLLDVGFIMTDIENAINQVQRSMFTCKTIEQLSQELPAVEWLWPGYIPYHEITAIGGREGTGKTAIIHDWVRRIVNHLPMPDGTMPNLKSDKVLFLDAEDFCIGIKERTEWWKKAEEGFWGRNGGFEVIPYPTKNLLDLAQPEQQLWLEEIIREVGPCLLWVDSWQASILRSTFDEQVAHVIQYLKNIAKRYNLAVIVTMHLNKDDGDPYRKPNSTAFKGAGSAAYRFRATYSTYRLQLGGVKDITKDARVIEAFRVSAAVHPRPIICTFEPLHPHGFFVKYHDPDELFMLKESLETDDDVEPMTSIEQAEAFIRSTLFIEGALSYDQLKKAGQEEGIGVRSLADAVKNLKYQGEIMNTIGERRKGNKLCLAEGYLDRLK